ncbi:NAD(+) diphosphatase [Lysobacter pythonis]|uniref:NAD(+) diphosphatase n=1 Tax=Solilutibacter pythonis TaxID=2483112 RepID=A0A3M2HX68_9GAMM|nr:NAD(+) diphosphatase [Lysobacter pythonis]RMH92865.1 NAD(+) diphosphatase [Lysobacter pythonis]
MNPPSFAFIAEALDRADELRRDAAALDALRADARCLRLDARGQVAVESDGRPRFERGAPAYAVFLGLGRGEPWFAALGEAGFAQGAPLLDLRAAAATWPAFEATLFAQARAVLHWRGSHRFCPGCGGVLAYSRGGWQGDCAACGRTEYPRSDPAVIVAVSDGERLLLGRQAAWPARRYSVLAGFVEPGESLEQTVTREVYEESRVRVLRSRYLASQPWPFPGSLMLGFIAEAHPDAPRTAQDELEDARWFGRGEILAALAGDDGAAPLRLSPPMSISRWLIECWVAGERA